MKFRLHFTLQDDSHDFIIIEGETIEEIQKKAKVEKEKRNAKDAWSEEL